jgi:hypothetical protein
VSDPKAALESPNLPGGGWFTNGPFGWGYYGHDGMKRCNGTWVPGAATATFGEGSKVCMCVCVCQGGGGAGAIGSQRRLTAVGVGDGSVRLCAPSPPLPDCRPPAILFPAPPIVPVRPPPPPVTQVSVIVEAFAGTSEVSFVVDGVLQPFMFQRLPVHLWLAVAVKPKDSVVRLVTPEPVWGEVGMAVINEKWVHTHTHTRTHMPTLTAPARPQPVSCGPLHPRFTCLGCG